jgi:V/A-type H+-transporting ATPase subunit D
VLPSLELKRQQLLADRHRELQHLESVQARLKLLSRQAGERFPMLAGATISLEGLARVERIELHEKRILGTVVPILAEIYWSKTDYSLLATPHWVDGAIDVIRQMTRQRLEVVFATERVRRIDRAIRVVVQRVNLFQKVLLPTAKSEIQRIRIALADAERAAVVRSKIFKSRHERIAEPRP